MPEHLDIAPPDPAASTATDGGDAPKPMPEDAGQYSNHVSITNFINAYYQVRDTLSYKPSRVLVVGIGVGLDVVILRERFGLHVETMDIDAGFGPDHVGSVHDMSLFGDQGFDVVIASHVLEHLPFRYFRQCLSELARVSRHSLIYLPYGGKHPEMRLTLSERRRDYRCVVNLPPFTKRNISGEQAELQSKAHYWECGYPKFGVRTITGIISDYFIVDKVYHNLDWKYSLNYLLTSRRVDGWTPGANTDFASTYHFQLGPDDLPATAEAGNPAP